MSTSHLTNPLGYRSGKTFLWTNNSILGNNKTFMIKDINKAEGLEQAANHLLMKNNYMIVKSVSNVDQSTNVVTLNILYYPLYAPFLRKKAQPTYLMRRSLLNKLLVLSSRRGFRFLRKSWNSLRMFSIHKRSKRRKKRFQEWMLKSHILQARFRGTNVKRSGTYLKKTDISAYNSDILGSKIIVNQLFNKGYCKEIPETASDYIDARKNFKKTLPVFWEKSDKTINTRQFSKQLSKRTGVRVSVKLVNVFSYIQQRYLSKARYDTKFYFNRKYNYYSQRFTAFYDILNAFYVASYIPKTEKLFIHMLQNAMANMDKKGLRPKHFFYFLNAVANNMKEVQLAFKAFRFVITGKLGGGTGRTKTLSLGFGALPRQTLKSNLRYEFGDLHSKYGAFGLRVFTWRRRKFKFTKFFNLKFINRKVSTRSKTSYLKLATSLISHKLRLSSRVFEVLKQDQNTKASKLWIQNKIFKKAQEKDSRITKDKANILFNKTQYTIRVKKKPSKNYTYSVLLNKRKLSRLIKVGKSREYKFVDTSVIKPLKQGILSKFRRLFKMKNQFKAEEHKTFKNRPFSSTLKSKFYRNNAFSIGRSPMNEQIAVHFKSKSKVNLKAVYRKHLYVRARLQRKAALDFIKNGWRWKLKRQKGNKEGIKRFFRRTLPVTNSHLRKMHLSTKKVKTNLLIPSLLKSARVKKFVKNNKNLIKKMDYKGWRLQYLKTFPASFPSHKPLSLNKIGLTSYSTLWYKKALISRSINHALTTKVFRRPSKKIIRLVIKRFANGRFGSIQFYSIPKKRDWFTQIYSSGKLKRKRWYKKGLRKQFGDLIHNADIGLRFKALVTRERLVSRNRLKFLKADWQAYVKPSNFTKIASMRRDFNIPRESISESRADKLFTLTKSTSTRFKTSLRPKIFRNFWVRRFYDRISTKFAISSKRQESKKVLSKKTSSYLKEVNLKKPIVSSRGIWFNEFRNLSEIQKEGQYIPSNKKTYPFNLSYSKRLYLFNKGLLDKALHIKPKAFKPYRRW